MPAVVTDTFHKNEQTVNVIQPAANANRTLTALITYISENKKELQGLLLKNGAILFRGFDINDREEFLKVKEAYGGEDSFNYVDGNSPRTKLSSQVYTSTEYPSEFRISLHSEMSYSNKWPGTIFFYCKTPAEEAGETPIVDCRYILKKIDQEVVDNFERLGVKYTRYLPGAKGMGKTWMDTFETTDKETVESYCTSNGIEFRWEGNALCLSQQGAGVAVHPVTKERVWFNQANQFHPSGLPEDIYKGLKLIHAKNRHRFPQYAFYGNGEEIGEQHLKDITEIHFDCALVFKWQQGDVLMLDNMLMAHGRMPFKGDRKIYVSMC